MSPVKFKLFVGIFQTLFSFKLDLGQQITGLDELMKLLSLFFFFGVFTRYNGYILRQLSSLSERTKLTPNETCICRRTSISLSRPVYIIMFSEIDNLDGIFLNYEEIFFKY